MILEITNLGCGYSSGFNLNGISMSLNSGETLILMGENGVGKSTLLRAIAGLISVNKGQITIDGTDVTNNLDTKGETFSYLGHLNGLKEHLTVKENLAFWSNIFGESENNILEDFDLKSITKKKISACSSGQKRMVGLARIFNSPKNILLLDEPMIGLDVKNKKRVLNKIKQHNNQGGMVIIVSHDSVPSDKTFKLTSNLNSSSNPSIKDTNPFLNYKV